MGEKILSSIIKKQIGTKKPEANAMVNCMLNNFTKGSKEEVDPPNTKRKFEGPQAIDVKRLKYDKNRRLLSQGLLDTITAIREERTYENERTFDTNNKVDYIQLSEAYVTNALHFQNLCLPTIQSLLGRISAENYEIEDYEDAEGISLLREMEDNLFQVNRNSVSNVDTLSILTNSIEDTNESDLIRSYQEYVERIESIDSEIREEATKYHKSHTNKRLNKFLTKDKNQTTITMYTPKRKKEEKVIIKDANTTKNYNFKNKDKQQVPIDKYTIHQSGEEMFEILENGLKRKREIIEKRQFNLSNKPTIIEPNIKACELKNQQKKLNERKTIDAPEPTVNKPLKKDLALEKQNNNIKEKTVVTAELKTLDKNSAINTSTRLKSFAERFLGHLTKPKESSITPISTYSKENENKQHKEDNIKHPVTSSSRNITNLRVTLSPKSNSNYITENIEDDFEDFSLLTFDSAIIDKLFF
ncbi:hypothetical protein ABK040_003084 [Willaertia magna]